MRVYKHIQFGEGINCTLAEFKKIFKSHLVGLTVKEVKEAHKKATNGNISRATDKSKKANTPKGKE